MTQGKELQQQAAAYHALTPYMTHVDILSDQVASYSRAIGDVMELGWDLQPGEDTGLVELNGYLFLVQCTSRVEYDYQPFEQVQSVILSQMRKERYETLLQQTADSLTIEADLTKLESFIIQEMERMRMGNDGSTTLRMKRGKEAMKKRWLTVLTLLIGIAVTVGTLSGLPGRASAAGSGGTTYYFSTLHGDNNNSGTSQEQAWASLHMLEEKEHYAPGWRQSVSGAGFYF